MFKLLFEEITVKNLNFSCLWMPSHSAQKGTELPPDVSPLDVIGNDFADKQADLAAAYHVISLNASSVALWYGCLAYRIQRRNVCILASLDARKRGEPPNKQEMILPKLPDPEALFPFSSHVAFNTGTGFIRCARCNQSYDTKHEYVRKFLLTDCPMINSDVDRPRPIALELLRIGNRGIHPSHHINNFPWAYLLQNLRRQSWKLSCRFYQVACCTLSSAAVVRQREHQTPGRRQASSGSQVLAL